VLHLLHAGHTVTPPGEDGGVLADLLLPARCPVCRAPAVWGALGPCRRCEVPPPPALPPPPGVDRCHAAFAYDGGGVDVVAALKFRAERAALAWVALVLAARVDVRRIDVVTWVPTTGARGRRRGGDHAERLARALAGRLGLPARRLLVRRPGPPQAGRGAIARRAGPPLAPARRSPPGVLVVDDVVTTGGSVAAAARALRAAGATTVDVAAAARTPPTRLGRHEPRATPTQGGRDRVREPRGDGNHDPCPRGP
jgi:predicted amidophosphoribosyltransferase